jgi:hypothetical protein
MVLVGADPGPHFVLFPQCGRFGRAEWPIRIVQFLNQPRESVAVYFQGGRIR